MQKCLSSGRYYLRWNIANKRLSRAPWDYQCFGEREPQPAILLGK